MTSPFTLPTCLEEDQKNSRKITPPTTPWAAEEEGGEDGPITHHSHPSRARHSLQRASSSMRSAASRQIDTRLRRNDNRSLSKSSQVAISFSLFSSLLFYVLLASIALSAPRVAADVFDSEDDLPDIHRFMDRADLATIFQVEDPDSVPLYDIVKIHPVNNKYENNNNAKFYKNTRRKRDNEEGSEDFEDEEEFNPEDFEKVDRETYEPKKNHRENSESTTQEQPKTEPILSGNEDEPFRQLHRVNFTAFGKKITLNLVKNEFLLKQTTTSVPVWYADNPSQPGGEVTFTPAKIHHSEQIGHAYQDPDNQAAVLIYKDKNHEAVADEDKDEQHLIDGMVGEDLIIKPLSFQLKAKLRRNYTDMYGNTDGSTAPGTFYDRDYFLLDEEHMAHAQGSTGGGSASSATLRRRRKREAAMVDSGVHIIYKRKAIESLEAEYDFLEEDHGEHKHEAEDEEEFPDPSLDEGDEEPKNRRRKPRQAPLMIFPEILCIVDYDGYRLHGKDNVAIKRYVISFWNGIDLRYKLLHKPNVKISIAGIIISRGRDATPYLERNRVGHDAIDSASALTDMGKYLFLERRLPVYDIAVAITKLDMCRRKNRFGECNRGTAGFAYVGGACVVNKRLEKVNSVAIVEDTGGFSGIIVAAHELGHLLGAVHDGSPPPSYLGGPGARKCRWEEGFIMSDLRHTSKGFTWSHCSVQQFQHFLNGETATCMYNSPHEEDTLPRVLPGKLLSLDAQCRKDRGTSACFKDDRVCAQLFCFDAGSGYCVSYRPAAEGSKCGDKQICLNGICQDEQINAIDHNIYDY